MSPARQVVTNEQVITAYRDTGNVWKAGRALGIAGQSVHERLTHLGYDLPSRTWTQAELDELAALAGHVTVGEIARRLGRPYHGVATKLSRLGIGTRYGNRVKVKVPRGAGYDKASLKRYIREIDATNDLVSRFARRNRLGVEGLCQAIERHFPEWWEQYRRAHSDLAETQCKGCDLRFIPSNARQEYHSRACGSNKRRDDSYFGGNRSQTIGLAEGICQLCSRQVTKGLSSHHILGKENDPENLSLIALCQGCHKVVTLLAARTFVDDAGAWEDLIILAWLRRHGADVGFGVTVSVSIEVETEDVGGIE